MLTPFQVRRANDLFATKATPEEVANELGMTLATLRYHLRESGYRIKSDTVRFLEPLVPVAPQEHAEYDMSLLAAA